MCVCVYVRVCISHVLYSSIHQWTLRLIPCLNYCKLIAGNTMVYIFFQVTGFDFLHIFASTYFLFYNSGLVSKLYLTLATPWTIACQALLSMGFFRQEYWTGLPFPSIGDLPNPGTKPRLLRCRQILYRLSYKGSSPFFNDSRSNRYEVISHCFDIHFTNP